MNAYFIFGSTEHVAWPVTAIFASLLVALIVCLALEEKLHAKKSVIAGLFAVACFLLAAVLGILPFDRVVVGSHQMVQHHGVEGDYEFDQELDQNGRKIHIKVEGTDHRDAGQSQHQAEHPLHVDGHRLAMPAYIPGIDWGVIAIILGSSLFVDITSRSGLFTWIAIRVTKASGGDPLKLLYLYGIMTVVFSAVLNNVTAMIIVGSLTAVSLEKLGRREKLLGFLLIEGLLTNVGGLLTLISSVPNIIVGAAADIDFITFFLKAGPYVLVTMLVTIWMGSRLFGIEGLKDDAQRAAARRTVADFDENDGVQSWGFFWFGAAMLVLFILAIATTSILPLGIKHLGMGFVALSFAVVMLLRYKAEADQFYKNIDWDLLGFFVALFAVIYVMEHAQVLASIGRGIEWVATDIEAERAGWLDRVLLLVGAAGFSSVTDNIPLSAMLANILSSLGAPPNSALWWSVIFGANLGGNLTPIGSASTLVAVTIIHKHKLPMSFVAFMKAALPFAGVQIALAILYVLLLR